MAGAGGARGDKGGLPGLTPRFDAKKPIIGSRETASAMGGGSGRF